MAHAGWRHRNYIPHCDAAGLIQHVVFGLASAPVWPKQAPSSIRFSDAACELLQSALLHFDGERYRLVAWCVMPTHVHVLIEQLPEHRLDRVVHSWKSFTANGINRQLGRRGKLWHREYFDRFMRTDEQLISTIWYIEKNPVEAGLVKEAADWKYSSAHFR